VAVGLSTERAGVTDGGSVSPLDDSVQRMLAGNERRLFV
jgi:hypothetical protein